MNVSVIKWLPIGFFAFLALSNSLFTLNETEQALVIQFGDTKRVISTPGLKIKLPFIQDLVYFDKRLLDFDLPAQEVIAGDQERIVVDVFTRYHIEDPLKYFQTVQNESGVKKRLITIVQGTLRSVLGNYPLATLLSTERSVVMHQIHQEVIQAAKGLGIKVTYVGIRRADLPIENSKAIFRRMATEREVMAKELRSVGKELAVKICSNADRQSTILIAEAEQTAQEIRGQGDAEAIIIYADAFNRDPQFFDFYRSLEAYKTTLGQSDTTLILSPKGEFFKYLHQSGAGKGL